MQIFATHIGSRPEFELRAALDKSEDAVGNTMFRGITSFVSALAAYFVLIYLADVQPEDEMVGFCTFVSTLVFNTERPDHGPAKSLLKFISRFDIFRSSNLDDSMKVRHVIFNLCH